MSDELNKTALEQIARVMNDHGVVYLVIGGQAEYLFGGHRPTFDVDLCYQRSPENLKRLAEALKPLKPTLRNAPPGLPFFADARALGMGSNFTFRTEAGDLDLLGYVEPIGAYEQLEERAEMYELAGLTIRTIGIEDLIRVKEHIHREKDKESLRELWAIRELRRMQDKSPEE